MNIHKPLLAGVLAVLFLAACGSSGIDDVLGGGSSSGTGRYELRGTVESIDLNSRSMMLSNVSGYDSMLSGGGNTVRVYFDDRTAVDYQGQAYRPGDLERGDQVTVRVSESGNSLLAESMTVTYDSSGGNSYPGSGTATSTLRGTVTYVDTSRRTIEVDRGYGSRSVVEYDTATPVYFNNQTYRVADLERGDEIDVRVRDFGGGRLVAQDISVLRSVSSGTTGSSTSMSTIRGTVRYVDTSRRTIELESARGISSFDTGSTLGNRVVVQYDANTSVDVSGRLHPVSGLEPGDVIDVRVQNVSGGGLFAQQIILVRDVNAR